MKPSVDAEARGVADAAFLALINAHRATSGYSPLSSMDAVRHAYMASPRDGMGERWLEHERRKSDAAVATALAASQARVEELERQVADHDADRAAVDDALLNMDFGEWEGDLQSVAAIMASDMRRVVSETRRRAERRRRQARALSPEVSP